MRENLEVLKYSTLAPSRYVIYLHPNEFSRLEGILPILEEQTRRALTEEVAAMNRRSLVERYAGRLFGEPQPHVENVAGAWEIAFLSDPDGDLEDGAILIDSELVLPAMPELGVGQRTRRVSTVHVGQQSTTRHRAEIPPRLPADIAAPERNVPSGPAATSMASAATTVVTTPIVARLSWHDDAGAHTFEMSRDTVTIGRGGAAYHVDIRIAASPDVSREHARIRRDRQTGRFFLVDLSSLGTTLNGRHVPRGLDEVDGRKTENGAETPLPERGRIGLADIVFIDFSAGR